MSYIVLPPARFRDYRDALDWAIEELEGREDTNGMRTLRLLRDQLRASAVPSGEPDRGDPSA